MQINLIMKTNSDGVGDFKINSDPVGDFIKYPKIGRLFREIIITEKIDGTNAQIDIDDYLNVRAGSRNRWVTIDDDNYGFAQWVADNANDLRNLGPGRHFGEWWGQGINRNYGLKTRKFSLFNVSKWNLNNIPLCCNVVPVLYRGMFSEKAIIDVFNDLKQHGSKAAPQFNDPEGIIVFHTSNNTHFKFTYDDRAKSES